MEALGQGLKKMVSSLENEEQSHAGCGTGVES